MLYFVRNTAAEAQLAEVVGALQLEAALSPFTRCRECNELLVDVAKADVVDRLPEKVRGFYERFKRCPGCDRVYWEGTHFERMQGVLSRLAGATPSGA
jgi:uncharacterized protein with PIN domain